MGKILLEISCGSIDDALQAQAGGADRVELASALFVGGLTPSIGTLRYAREHLRIPILYMVRPRAAGFCYSEAEFATMQSDIAAAIAAGADGVVFGCLNGDGSIDVQRARTLRDEAGAADTVFHRAFDFTPDPFRALDQLVDAGFTRVLTSGQQPTALEGAELIRQLIEHARGRIEILPGSGIRAWNVEELLARTGCTQVHMSASRAICDPSAHARPQIRFTRTMPPEDSYQMTDETLVREMVNKLAARSY